MSKKIVKEFGTIEPGKKFPINGNDMSRVIFYTDGACIQTKYDENGVTDIEYDDYDVPFGVYIQAPYCECVKLLKEAFHPTEESNTQTIIREFDDGTFIRRSLAMVQYYEPNDPENSPKLYDENDNLIYRDNLPDKN